MNKKIAAIFSLVILCSLIVVTIPTVDGVPDRPRHTWTVNNPVWSTSCDPHLDSTTKIIANDYDNDMLLFKTNFSEKIANCTPLGAESLQYVMVTISDTYDGKNQCTIQTYLKGGPSNTRTSNDVNNQTGFDWCRVPLEPGDHFTLHITAYYVIGPWMDTFEKETQYVVPPLPTTP